MGIHKTILLAPYLEIRGNKIVNEPKIKRYCLLHPRKEQFNNKFCSECGSLIITEDIPFEKKYEPVEYIFTKSKIDTDFLYCVESVNNCVYSNRIMPSEIRIAKIESDYNEFIDLTPIDVQSKINQQISWFTEAHVNEILEIKKIFGEENVFVRWGLTHYWS